MVKRKTSESVLNYRTSRIHGLIKSFGGSANGARYLSSHRKIRVEEVARRIEVLEKLKLKPGIIRVMGFTKKEFSEFVARKTGSGRDSLFPTQREAYELLIWKGAGVETALKIASMRGMNKKFCEKRFALLEQKLDYSKYGSNKIPKGIIPSLLHLKPVALNEVLNSHVLPVIENFNAKRILDGVFPSWKRMSVVYGVIEPRTVLTKFEYLVKKGRVPTMWALREYSVKELAKRANTLEKLNPRLKKWMLERTSELRRVGINPGEEKILLEKLKKEYIRKK